MTGLADAIVGFWFLPVILFVFLPLIMLCAWTLFGLTMSMVRKQRTVEREDNLMDTVGLAETG